MGALKLDLSELGDGMSRSTIDSAARLGKRRPAFPMVRKRLSMELGSGSDKTLIRTIRTKRSTHAGTGFEFCIPTRAGQSSLYEGMLPTLIRHLDLVQ